MLRSILHFSHNHRLQLVSFTQSQPPHVETRCCGQLDSSNNEKSTDPLYACTACNFYIHRACSKLPPLITHPCHPSHNLALIPISIYTDGSFTCDACSKSSTSFLYTCEDCCYDIHTHCATMPLTIDYPSHHHPLNLSFSCLYTDNRFSCDVCNGIGERNWLYRCDSCGFDAHLDCARNKPSSSLAGAPALREPVRQRPYSHVEQTGPGVSAPSPRVRPSLVGHEQAIPVRLPAPRVDPRTLVNNQQTGPQPVVTPAQRAGLMPLSPSWQTGPPQAGSRPFNQPTRSPSANAQIGRNSYVCNQPPGSRVDGSTELVGPGSSAPIQRTGVPPGRPTQQVGATPFARIQPTGPPVGRSTLHVRRGSMFDGSTEPVGPGPSAPIQRTGIPPGRLTQHVRQRSCGPIIQPTGQPLVVHQATPFAPIEPTGPPDATPYAPIQRTGRPPGRPTQQDGTSPSAPIHLSRRPHGAPAQHNIGPGLVTSTQTIRQFACQPAQGLRPSAPTQPTGPPVRLTCHLGSRPISPAQTAGPSTGTPAQRVGSKPSAPTQPSEPHMDEPNQRVNSGSIVMKGSKSAMPGQPLSSYVDAPTEQTGSRLTTTGPRPTGSVCIRGWAGQGPRMIGAGGSNQPNVITPFQLSFGNAGQGQGPGGGGGHNGNVAAGNQPYYRGDNVEEEGQAGNSNEESQWNGSDNPTAHGQWYHDGNNGGDKGQNCNTSKSSQWKEGGQYGKWGRQEVAGRQYDDIGIESQGGEYEGYPAKFQHRQQYGLTRVEEYGDVDDEDEGQDVLELEEQEYCESIYACGSEI